MRHMLFLKTGEVIRILREKNAILAIFFLFQVLIFSDEGVILLIPTLIRYSSLQLNWALVRSLSHTEALSNTFTEQQLLRK